MHIPFVSIKNMQNSQPGRSFSKLPDQVAKPPILALLNYGTFLVILVQLHPDVRQRRRRRAVGDRERLVADAEQVEDAERVVFSP